MWALETLHFISQLDNPEQLDTVILNAGVQHEFNFKKGVDMTSTFSGFASSVHIEP